MKPANYILAALLCGLAGSAVFAQSPPSIVVTGVPQSQYIRVAGKCLYVALNGTEGAMPQARLATCADRGEMRWTISGSAAKGYRIHPRNRTDQCLDIDGKTMNKYNTRVVLWTCQAGNDYQLWSFAPVTTTLYNGSWAIFNRGLVGIAGENRPKVLTFDDRDSYVYATEFHSGQFQEPASQIWSSQEIWCYHNKRKHAGGLETTSYSAGGHSVSTTIAKCE